MGSSREAHRVWSMSMRGHKDLVGHPSSYPWQHGCMHVYGMGMATSIIQVCTLLASPEYIPTIFRSMGGMQKCQTCQKACGGMIECMKCMMHVLFSMACSLDQHGMLPERVGSLTTSFSTLPKHVAKVWGATPVIGSLLPSTGPPHVPHGTMDACMHVAWAYSPQSSKSACFWHLIHGAIMRQDGHPHAWPQAWSHKIVSIIS